MRLGYQQAGRRERRRLLHGVHQAEQRVDDVNMPHAQRRQRIQRQHHQRPARGDQVAHQHDALFVPPVGQRAADEAEEYRRKKRAQRQQRHAGRRPSLPVDPDDQRIVGHGRAKLRHGLRAPQQQKAAQVFEYRCVFHGFSPRKTAFFSLETSNFVQSKAQCGR